MTDVETANLYSALPEYLRAADDQMTGHPLLSYVTGIGARLQVVATLLDRLNHYTPTVTNPPVPSDLSDPDAADPEWLDWLAQAVGARLTGISDLTARRDAIRFAAAGWRVGTKGAIADAARSALTGTRYARVYDHSATAIGTGGPADVLIVTRVSETPDVTAVLTAVIAKGAKPAGVVLHHLAYSATYTEVQGATTPDTYAARQTRFPTYQDAADYLP